MITASSALSSTPQPTPPHARTASPVSSSTKVNVRLLAHLARTECNGPAWAALMTACSAWMPPRALPARLASTLSMGGALSPVPVTFTTQVRPTDACPVLITDAFAARPQPAPFARAPMRWTGQLASAPAALPLSYSTWSVSLACPVIPPARSAKQLLIIAPDAWALSCS